MTGLVAILNAQEEETTNVRFGKMMQCLRSPDNMVTGNWSDESRGIRIGWNVRCDTFSDCMPIRNENKSCVLFFFGEHFGSKEEVLALKRNNHNVSKTNASYLIHLYEELGIDFLNQLNGYFCGILIDLRSHETFLFNDRFGIQRLHIHEYDGQIFVASNIQSLLKAFPELRSISDEALTDWITHSSSSFNGNLFQKVAIPPAATLWSINPGQAPKKSVYFNLEVWDRAPYLGEDYFVHRLQDTLQHVLSKYTQVGNSISFLQNGGIGSQLISKSFTKSVGKLPSISFSLDGKTPSAARLAEELGFKHALFENNPALWENFESHAIRAITDSNACAGIECAFLSKFAQDAGHLANAALTDLCWKEFFVPQQIAPHTQPVFDCFTQGIQSSAERSRPDTDKGNLKSWLQSTLPGLWQRQAQAAHAFLPLRTPFLDKDIVPFFFRMPTDHHYGLKTINDTLSIEKPNQREASRIQRGHAWKLIRSLLGSNGTTTPKAIASKDITVGASTFGELALDSYVSGYWAHWFRDEIRSFIFDILQSQSASNRAYITKPVLQRLLDEHDKKKRDHAPAIAKLISLELIHRTFVD